MHRSSLVLVVTLVALAGCATMGRQVETDSGDLATDLEQARQDTARARATFDTLIGQRRAIDARSVAVTQANAQRIRLPQRRCSGRRIRGLRQERHQSAMIG